MGHKYYIICVYLWSFSQIIEADVNVTAIEIRLLTVEQGLAQEKILRRNLEMTLSNTYQALQQERRMRENLEKTLERTLNLLTNTTQQLHDESTSRIILQRDMERKIGSITRALQTTSQVLQQESNKRGSLEKKCDETIVLLRNATQELHDESTSRILLERDMVKRFDSITKTLYNTSLMLNQERNMRVIVEKKLDNITTVLKHTRLELQNMSLALQGERNIRVNIEHKLDNITEELNFSTQGQQNVTLALQNEKNLRGILEQRTNNNTNLLNKLGHELGEVKNNSLTFQTESPSLKKLAKKVEDVESVLTNTTKRLIEERRLGTFLYTDTKRKLHIVNDSLQQLMENTTAEDQNLMHRVDAVQTQSRQTTISLFHESKSLSDQIMELKHAVTTMNLSLTNTSKLRGKSLHLTAFFG